MTDIDAGRTALYRLYDADGALLYIGISSNPQRRWKQHALESRNSPERRWWFTIDNRTVDWFESRAEAEAAESAAITAEGPLHNRAGNAARIRRAVEAGRLRRLIPMDAVEHYLRYSE